MNNPFKISRRGLQQLFVAHKKRAARDLLLLSRRQFSPIEIMRQLKDDSSPVMNEIIVGAQLEAKKTENVEIYEALGLSDFYWPHSETEIFFELKNGVLPSSIVAYPDLVNGLEDNTHVDCQIRGDGKTRSFQIKRYSQEYLEHSDEAFLQWLTEKVFRSYGDMSGTILVILLQPAVAFTKCTMDFTKLFSNLVDLKGIITFDEIVLSYNEQSLYMVLHRLYPTYKRFLIPFDLALDRLKGKA